MITDIWVEGKKWDLYSETNIKHTIQVNDISDVRDRQASFTNSFSTPKTPNNIRIANGLGIPGDTSRIPYEKPSCLVKIDGFDLIIKGWINITDTDDEYKIYIYSGIITFFKTIENINIGDLVLSEINHTKNLTSVVGSFSNPNYRYLITDYNGLTHYGDNSEIINIDYLVPSVNVKYLWDKIHNTYSFTYSGGTFSTEEFTNLWLTYPKSIAIDDVEDMVEGEGSRYIDTHNGSESSYYRGIFLTNFDNSRCFTADETSQYRITFEIDNTFEYQLQATVKYFMSINQDNIAWINRDGVLLKEVSAITNSQTFSKIINLNEGDVISFYDYLKMGGYLRWQSNWNIKIEKIISGTTDFNEELKDFLITDFVKEILNQFGLTMFPDEFSNEMKYLTIAERINGKVIDWSKKYIERINENYVYSSYAQKNIFTYKYNDEESTYNDSSINISNVNLKASQTSFSSKTYSPEQSKVDFYVGSDGTQSVPVFKIYDKSVEEDEDGTTTIEYKGLEKRFHFIRQKTISTNVQIGSKTLTDIQTVNSIPIASFDGLDWRTLQYKNYSEFGRMLNDSRIHTISLNLNLIDLLKLDLTGTYFFSQESQYYILNKLTFNNDSFSGEYVRVKKEIDTTIVEPVENSVSISWEDNTTVDKTGTDDTINIQIDEILDSSDDELISFEWEKYNGTSWDGLGTGISPYTASLSIIGLQKFRIKATSVNSNVIYSNELQYTKTEIIICHEYHASAYGNSGDDLTAWFTDCNGEEQTLTVYAPGGSIGFSLELTFCAKIGSVSINRGELEELGTCMN